MEKSKEKSLYSPGYKLEDLKQYISRSKWSSKCGFIEKTTDITELCHEFLSLLREPCLLQDAAEFVTAVCMLMLVDKTKLSWVQSVNARMLLKSRTFFLINAFKAEDLPRVTKVLWKGLKLDDRSSLQNILDTSRNLANSSATGRAMAMILIWMIISNIIEIEPKFREFWELIKILEWYAKQRQQIDVHLEYILIQCCSTLVSIITNKQNQDLKELGLAEYFNFSRSDMEKLMNCMDTVEINFGISATLDNEGKFKLAISEIAQITTMAVLEL